MGPRPTGCRDLPSPHPPQARGRREAAAEAQVPARRDDQGQRLPGARRHSGGLLAPQPGARAARAGQSARPVPAPAPASARGLRPGLRRLRSGGVARLRRDHAGERRRARADHSHHALAPHLPPAPRPRQVEGVRDPDRPFFSMADRRRRLHRDIMVEFARRTPECSKIFIPYASQVEQMGPGGCR